MRAQKFLDRIAEWFFLMEKKKVKQEMMHTITYGVSRKDVVIELTAQNNIELRIDVIQIKWKANVHFFKGLRMELSSQSEELWMKYCYDLTLFYVSSSRCVWNLCLKTEISTAIMLSWKVL